MHTRSIIYTLIVFLITVLGISCKDFLEVGNPPDTLVRDAVYDNSITASAVLTGILSDMQSRDGFAQGTSSVSLHIGLQSDEIAAYSKGQMNTYYIRQQRYDFWSPCYKFIYRVNKAIEGLSGSRNIPQGIKDHLLGEAYFLRAFHYFYLVNLYGDVPLVTTGDYARNSEVSRAPSSEIYQLIINDLNLAISLLSEDYLAADIHTVTIDRVRPNKWAAIALLSRVYLYAQQWEDAEKQASLVIGHTSLYDLTPLDDVFLMNSKEAIWQLQSIDDFGKINNVRDGEVFVLIKGPDIVRHPVFASDMLIRDLSIEPGDMRRSKWIGENVADNKTYHFFYKYKAYQLPTERPEYIMVIRLAEMYLIRSEARAHLNKSTEAREDLNALRTRAGLPDISEEGSITLNDAILRERRVELFSEWGHRWFDLKRTGKLNDVMPSVYKVKGITWQPYMQLFNIPDYDMQHNRNLHQNEGY